CGPGHRVSLVGGGFPTKKTARGRSVVARTHRLEGGPPGAVREHAPNLPHDRPGAAARRHTGVGSSAALREHGRGVPPTCTILAPRPRRAPCAEGGADGTRALGWEDFGRPRVL